MIAGLNFFAAESEKAKKLFTSLQIQFANLCAPGKLQPPLDNIHDYVSSSEIAALRTL